MKTVIGPPEAGKSLRAPRVSRPGNEQEGAQTTMTKAFFAWSGLAVLAALMAAPALADWNVGDPYKMHYPQLPKMDGWDVRASYYTFLADDWECTESGLVTDIHLWVSFKGDLAFVPDKLHTAIWSDDTSGPYSKPGSQLWHRDIGTMAYSMLPLGITGPQGWYDPSADPDVILRPDHERLFQINIIIPEAEAFYQTKGQVYWLEFTVQEPVGSGLGWKQSGSQQFRDDAVWRIQDGASWTPIKDPETNLSMDLAFVITPEPAAVVLLAVGSLLLRRRRA